MLRSLIERAVEPSGIQVIDSAESTAEAAVHLVNGGGAVGTFTLLGSEPKLAAETEIHCFATDSVDKFERLGSHFLGRPVGNVGLVDLGG